MVFIYLALCTIGLLNIHSATYNEKSPGFLDFNTDYGKQLIYVWVGISVGIVILLLESRFFSALSPFFYGVTVVLLVAVLVIGRNVGGNQAWIPLPGGFRLQPSEFAKLTTCLLLARYLSGTNIKITDTKSFLIASAIIGVPMVLIMRQPDAGSTLVFTSFLFVLYREGSSPYFLILEGLFIALFILTLKLNNTMLLVGIITGLAAVIVFLVRRNRKMIRIILTGLAICITFVYSVNFLYNHVLQPHQKGAYRYRIRYNN